MSTPLPVVAPVTMSSLAQAMSRRDVDTFLRSPLSAIAELTPGGASDRLGVIAQTGRHHHITWNREVEAADR